MHLSFSKPLKICDSIPPLSCFLATSLTNTHYFLFLSIVRDECTILCWYIFYGYFPPL